MYLQEISLILLIIFQINFNKYHYSSIRNVQCSRSKISIDCVTFFGTNGLDMKCLVSFAEVFPQTVTIAS